MTEASEVEDLVQADSDPAALTSRSTDLQRIFEEMIAEDRAAKMGEAALMLDPKHVLWVDERKFCFVRMSYLFDLILRQFGDRDVEAESAGVNLNQTSLPKDSP